MSGTSEGPRPAAVAAAGTVRHPITERHTLGRTTAEQQEQRDPGEPREPSAADPGSGSRSGPCRESEVRALRDYHAAFQVAPLAMAVIDHEGAIISANDALAVLLGTEPAALCHESAADLVDLASDSRTWHSYRQVLDNRRSRFRCTRRLKHADGRTLWVEVTVAPVPESGNVLLSIADISDRRELQARLRHLQMHDSVTRLPNRTLFFERLASALEASTCDTGAGIGIGTGAAVYGPGRRSYGDGGGDGRTGRIGLCYLDLDGFKAVNDTLGHRVGDRLLAAVASRLTECADHDGYTRNGGHLVARLGGDEFAILVEDSTGTEQLADLARSVLVALQRPFDLAGQRLSVSASIGVVERVAEGTTPTGLMQAADTTLYWAKADGKARWTLFDPERNAHRMTRQALTSTLRPAVEREEFVLQYQPLVGMADGVVRGVEALVRWNHPQFGTLAPNRFIGIAEEDGSIVQLGRWVLRTACRQARRWQLDHPDTAPLFVSVNVAVRQVWDSDLVTDVAEILGETGLAPKLLQLELTESAVMGSAGRPLQALQALSDMGVRIAIDDFGTGYSNLAYLSRLPVSVLKLDGSFVRGFRYDEGAHPSPADETIVEALVQLAHRLGLTVTAECVETSGQAARLQRIGCDTGQGWLFSRPVAPERIAEMIVAVAANHA
ncbi:putative bifunctional diguanylate cyclase/phosphodiesterase [Streptomyces corynorhini]|uniref:EAL domain-containing protein n=1 Tax=Streptomyces corynorhini TaxID=2282652 RepID=A0A370BED3_9ACTN|nr:EAL domain-containing protein [Streptomyces corynorhini]RDG37795.1 EAL domain-containing protein [Streptomyces corynorhini]